MKIPLKQYWLLVSKYLKPQWPRALLLTLLLLFDIVLRLLNPQIMRFFIDTIVKGGPLRTLINAALIFLGMALISQGLSIANTYFSEKVAWTAINSLRLDLLLHCLNLDLSFHKKHPSGELVERIEGDVNSLSYFFSRLTVGLLSNMLLMVGVLLLLLREDWRIGLSLSLFALFALLVMNRIRTIGISYWKDVREIMATFYGFFGEQLGGIEDIRANGARGYVMNRFDQLMQKWFPIRRKAMMASAALWSTNVGLFALIDALVFGLSAYLWRLEAITLGTVYLIFYYVGLLKNPMTQIRDQIESLQQAEANIERIRNLFAIQSKLSGAGTGALLPTGPLSVAFQDVSFSYDHKNGEASLSEIVLNNVTFQLEAGRVLGLLGRTGSGKTTIARLLLGLYDPQSGEIRLGGKALTTIAEAHLRQYVGMVTQDVQLFQATVRDNLIFFKDNITDQQIMMVLHDLGLIDWLNSLSDGLDSQLEQGSSGLSAGQAQLLAFARVFLTNPGLVILDEASSRLDPVTEQLIERAVSKLLENRTAIIIAHRLTTVLRADEILILSQGQVVEYGDRIQLASDPTSHFYQLLKY